ncbi:MAG: hypothetical protein HQK87_04705, partial [Nitrospinae bacterium]|nr:hypothetical protein [Nitrospinota bacterium]
MPSTHLDHTVNFLPGSINLHGVGDVSMLGLLLAGGRSEMKRDANGKYIGRNIVHYDVDSTVSVGADRQLFIGTDITAGKKVDLIGGLDSRAASIGSPYTGRGLVLYGSASVATTRANGEINLNAPGRVDILAPGDVNELTFADWPVSADGRLNQDVTLVVQLDRVSFTVEATVTVTAASTASNTTLSDLLADIDTALATSTWKVVQTDGTTTPALDTTYAGFAAMPDYDAIVLDARAKLRDGHIRLVGPYEIKVLAAGSVNASDLGVTFGSGVTELHSGSRHALDASGQGSTVTIGKPGGPNGKLYIAGKVRAYSGINLNSGASADGKDIDLDATGVLETIDGDIAFQAGENGVLQGDVLAHGAGRDVTIRSGRSLTIEGLIEANDQVRLTGGDGTLVTTPGASGYRSFTLANTATVRTLDAGGGITLTGTNQVYLDGTVETSLANQTISLSSSQGELILNRTSGRINAAGQLDISARDMVLDGPVISTFVAGNATAEIRLSAVRDAYLNGNLTTASQGDVSVSVGRSLSMIDSAWSAGSFTVAATDVTLGDGAGRGVTLDAGSALTMNLAGKLQVHQGVLLTTRNANSTIDLAAGDINVAGTLFAGARVSGGAAIANADGADLRVTAANTLRLGNGSVGGNAQATGNVTLMGGSGASNLAYRGAGLWIDNRSTVASANVAASASGTITLEGRRDLRIDGFVNATRSGGIVNVAADHLLTLTGMIQGHTSVNLTGGVRDATGLTVESAALVYKRNSSLNNVNQGTYFVDDQDRWMDASGNLVLDDAGNFMSETSSGAFASISDQQGGEPIRLTGAVVDTGDGGTIRIQGFGTMRLDGMFGQPYKTGSTPPVAVHVGTVRILGSSTGQTLVYGDINAENLIEITGQTLTVAEGAAFKSWAGDIDIVAGGNLLIQSNQTGLGNAMLDAKESVYLRANTLYQAGDVSAVNHVWLNAARDIALYGTVATSAADGVIDLRAGLSTTTSDDDARGTIARADLGAGTIYVLGDGKVQTLGSANLLAGTDLILNAMAAVDAGSRQVATPVISNEQVTYQIITGYNQVVDQVIDVPVVKWVTTTVTEQVGMESVKSGYYFTTMDVSLTQDGYFNGSTKREWFVEGVDYRNSSSSTGSGYAMTAADWAATGVAAPPLTADGNQPTFNQLSDLQRDAVLRALGYKKLFTFAAANLKKHQVINGNTTVVNWTPDWSLAPAAGTTRAMQTVNIPVDGWNDKWVYMPVGAEADVLRVVSQGAPVTWYEQVGSYKEMANVYYTQDKSARTQSAATGYERYWGLFPALGNKWISEYPTATNSDFDNSPLRYSVTYQNQGNWIYSLSDGTSNVAKARTPSWYGANPSVVGNDLVGNYTITPAGYNAISSSIAGGPETANWTVYVGQNTSYVPVRYHYIQSGYVYPDVWNQPLAQPTNARQNDGVWRSVVNDDGSLRDGHVWIGIHRQNNIGISTSNQWSGPFVYTSTGQGIIWAPWLPGEPNGQSGYEWVGEMITGNGGGGYWNDHDDNTYVAHYVTVSGGYWNNTNIYETFRQYSKPWTSINFAVNDVRQNLNYQWVSNSTDVFDNRPKFRTYDVTTKVVETARLTLYRDDPVYQDQTVTNSVRVDSGDPDTYGLFGRDSFDVGNLNVDVGRDARFSGIVKVSGALAVTTVRDLTLAGGTKTAEFQVTGNTLATVGRDATFDRASLATLGGNFSIVAGGNIHALGTANVTGAADWRADGDVNPNGTLTAANIIIAAGHDGVGGIAGDLHANLSATDITLSAGGVRGDIVFNQSGVTASGTLTLTAGGGNLRAYGNALHADIAVIGAMHDITGVDVGNDFLISASTLTASAESLRLANRGDLHAVNLTASAGDLQLSVDGNLVADQVSATGAVTLRTPLVTTLTRDLTVGTLSSGGVLTLDAGSTIRQTGAKSMTASRLNLTANESSTLIGLNVATLDARLLRVGNLDLTTTGAGTLTVERLATVDGTIALASSRNLDLRQVTSGRGASRTPTVDVNGNGQIDLEELPLDLAITTSGAIGGLGTGTHIAVNTDAGGAIRLLAATGIGGINVDVAELRDIESTLGDIVITDVATANRRLLRVTSAEALAGNLTLTSNVTLDVLKAHAAAAGQALTLTSSAGDVLIRAASAGGDLAAGASVLLDANRTLTIDPSVWVDASQSVTFRAGTSFTVPTLHNYATPVLTVVSGEDILVNDELRVGLTAQNTRVELRSGRDITVNAPIGDTQGSAVDDIVLYADGSSARAVQQRDDVTGLRMIQGASGQVYFEGTLPVDPTSRTYSPAGSYYTSLVGGKYVQDARDYRTNAAGVALRVLSDNADGTGALYALAGSDASGWSVGGLFAAPSATDLAAGKVIQIIDRSLVTLNNLAGAERASMTLSGLSVAGTVGIKLGVAGGNAPTVSATVTTGDLSALATAINAQTATTGITAAAIGGQLTLSRNDNQGINLSGFTHSVKGTLNVSGTQMSAITLETASQELLAFALTPKTQMEHASTITLNQGRTPYNRVSIDALSPVGTTNGNIVLSASQNLDLDAIRLHATGDLSIKTSGGAEAGQVMTLENSAGRVFANQVLNADQAANGVTWNLSGLANGSYTLRSVLRDSDGNVSYSGSYTTFTVSGSGASSAVPAALTPVITAPGSVVADPQTMLQGTGARAWTRVRLFEGATQVAEARADGSGNWKAALPVLADGSHAITARNVDDAGNLGSFSSAVTFTVDSQAPVAPQIAGYAAGTLSGTAEANALVKVYLNGGVNPVGTVSADGAGNWSLAHALADGSHAFRAMATDAAGNASGISGSLNVRIGAVANPALTITAPGTINSLAAFSGFTLTGGTDVGAGVKVTINGVDHAAWVEGASWSYTLSDTDITDLQTASGQFSVTATTPAGGTTTQNGSATLALTLPTLTVGISDNTITLAERLTGAVFTLSGTSSGSSVILANADGVVFKTLVPANGAWSYDLGDNDIQQLGSGSVDAVVIASDAANNTKLVKLPLTIEAPKPAKPTIEALDQDDGGADFITRHGRGGTLTVFGRSPAGTTVEASYIWTPAGGSAGSSTPVTPTVDPITGAWSALLPAQSADGSYSLAVVARNANNVASDEVKQTIVVDTTLPAAPNLSADSTTSARPLLSGTAETGAVITIYDGSTALVSFNPTGTDWQYQLPLSWAQGGGSHALTAKQTDVAGNTSVASGTVNVNPSGGSVGLTFNTITGDDSIDQNDRTGGVTLQGTTSGASVYLRINGAAVSGSPTVTSGAWSYTLSSADITALNASDAAITVFDSNPNSATNARQTIDLGGATAGTYTLSLCVDGKTTTTSSLAFDANDTAIQSALAALKLPGAVYSVSSKVVTFDGSLAGRAIPTMVLNATSLTGATSAGVTTTQSGTGVSALARTVSWVADNTGTATGNDAPVITAFTGSGQTPTVAGSAMANASVKLYMNTTSTLLATVKADANGNWRVDLTGVSLTGTDSLFATATGSSESAASASVKCVTAAPSLTFAPLPATILAADAARGVVLKGLTGASATSVTLSANNQSFNATLQPAVGGQQWSVVLSAANLAAIGDG